MCVAGHASAMNPCTGAESVRSITILYFFTDQQLAWREFAVVASVEALHRLRRVGINDTFFRARTAKVRKNLLS